MMYVIFKTRFTLIDNLKIVPLYNLQYIKNPYHASFSEKLRLKYLLYLYIYICIYVYGYTVSSFGNGHFVSASLTVKELKEMIVGISSSVFFPPMYISYLSYGLLLWI